MAAALASLDVLIEEGLVARAASLEPILSEGISAFARKYPQVGWTGARGLVGGIRIVRPGTREPDGDLALAVSQAAFRKVDFEYPCAAAQLGYARGARHFLLVSALGANAKSSVFYNRVKGEVEAAVLGVPYRSHTIVRPSLLVGEREETRLGEVIGAKLGFLVPRKYKPIPAEVRFTSEEITFAEPYRGMVMLVPEVKKIGHSNKDWGPIYWSQLDCLLHSAGIATVQCGPSGAHWLHNCARAVTPTFRHALAVLSVCRAVVTTEGGLMHGAAAVGVPAVVIWSEFISPEITGYSQHRNLRKAGESCGRRTDCPGCRKSLTAITPIEVFEALKEILR